LKRFFIERAKQLLKAGGVAAIILPSSILSNGSGTYIKTREILLQYFDIVAIAELGSGTFGKTGTNTVTLFLRRKKTTPDTAEHYRERVSQWFSADEDQAEYKDAHLIDRYCAHIGVPVADYKTLLAGHVAGPWASAGHFDVYTTAFNDSTEVKNLYKQKNFKLLGEAAQTLELQKRYLSFVQSQERDKLFYFVLVSDQTHPVLVIKSPSDTKAQKAFLGYDWSTSKGDEGIKLSKDAQGHHLTPMYDETNRDNPDKLNRLIADNFEGRLETIPTTLAEFSGTSRLVDMLDFTRAGFEKQIALKVKVVNTLNSHWPAKRLDEVCTFEYGKPLPESQRYPGPYPVMGSNGRVGFHSDFLVEGPTIVIGRKGSAGMVIWEAENCFPIDTTFYVKLLNADTVALRYLYLGLQTIDLAASKGGMGVPGLNRNDAYQLKLTIPPVPVQQKIVSEFEAIDAETASAVVTIKKSRQTSIKKFSSVLATTR